MFAIDHVSIGGARSERNLRICTMVATMLPYSIALLVCWTLLAYLRVFTPGLPVGPDEPPLDEARPAAAAAMHKRSS